MSTSCCRPARPAHAACCRPLITIGIAGGTGAGKTTLSRRLYEDLGGEEHVSYLLHDSYYKDFSGQSIDQKATNNFDHPASLETDLLLQHVRELKSGCSVQVPVYDFTTHSRLQATETVEPKKIILVEGILVFCHKELVNEFDVKVFVDADPDVRLMRRLSRDCAERGRSLHEVLNRYSEQVRPMHQQWVEPSKREADLVVHSSDRSTEIAIQMLCNHLKVTAGILLIPATVDAAAAAAGSTAAETTDTTAETSNGNDNGDTTADAMTTTTTTTTTAGGVVATESSNHYDRQQKKDVSSPPQKEENKRGIVVGSTSASAASAAANNNIAASSLRKREALEAVKLN